MDPYAHKLEMMTHKRSTVHIDILKQILLVATTLLGILIALRERDTTLPFLPRLLFPMALTGIAVGILFSGIALYGEYKGLIRSVSFYQAELKNSVMERRVPGNTYVPPLKLYESFEKAGYVSFCLSLVFLVTYSFLIML